MVYKKIILFCFLLVGLFIFNNNVLAQNQTSTQNENSTIYFFWSQSCPYCSSAKEFLKNLAKKYPNLEIKQYEFAKNINLIQNLYEKYEVLPQEQGRVPVIFTKAHYFVGFDDKVGIDIEKCVEECLLNGASRTGFSKQVKLPFLGEIEIESLSLPILAIILGALDGFNICSLGALILILSLVLALKSKKKILIFGSLFIVTTMAVYAILILLWHRLFVFISPHIAKMEIFIGALALIGALYFLNSTYKSIKNKNICKFGGVSSKIMQKVQRVFESKANVFVLAGAVLLFAAVVTMIEFPCTAFFPALFTSILVKSEISFNLSLLYIAIYAFFYMLDELAIFLVALFTMKIWIASPKIIAVINGIATLLLLLLGLYYFGLF